MDEFKKYADEAKASGNMAVFRRIMMERRIAFKIIDMALADRHEVSVNDGEEWTVIRSKDKAELRNSLFTTDEDQIVIRHNDGDKMGWFHLVYGNDGYDVIADHTTTDYALSIIERLAPMVNKMEMAA